MIKLCTLACLPPCNLAFKFFIAWKQRIESNSISKNITYTLFIIICYHSSYASHVAIRFTVRYSVLTLIPYFYQALIVLVTHTNNITWQQCRYTLKLLSDDRYFEGFCSYRLHALIMQKLEVLVHSNFDFSIFKSGIQASLFNFLGANLVLDWFN